MSSGKLILKGNLLLLSPLHIGSGSNDETDLDIIKDIDNKPFITFTSFVGSLKHNLIEKYNLDKKDLDSLFGYSKEGLESNDSYSSIISGKDIFLEEKSDFKILTRDGIKLDPKNGIVIEGAKYDYQILDKGAMFNFELEANYNENTLEKEKLKEYFALIVDVLKYKDNALSENLRIGFKTNSGLGKINLINEKIYDYNFEELSDLVCWLRRKEKNNTEKLDKYNGLLNKTKKEDLFIDAYFDLRTSLIQRSYNDDPNMPDSSHMQSDNKNILTGTGTKGAITNRIKKIINTMWKETSKIDKETFVNLLLGFVDEKNSDSQAIKSRFLIEENELPAYIAELQARIKIDRFTGGTIDGALFDSMPLFNSAEMSESTELKNKTRITMLVKKCSLAEAGLFMLVLKDLWTGDLAIGGEKGIGRGVFNGYYAKIQYKDENEIELSNKDNGLENLSMLNKYVKEFVGLAGGYNG